MCEERTSRKDLKKMLRRERQRFDRAFAIISGEEPMGKIVLNGQTYVPKSDIAVERERIALRLERTAAVHEELAGPNEPDKWHTEMAKQFRQEAIFVRGGAP